MRKHLRLVLCVPLCAAAWFAGACRLDKGTALSEWDVRGNYDLDYDNQLQLSLDVGGAVRHATSSGNGMVDFGVYNGMPLVLDLTQYCARPEVKCPSEMLWNKVAIDLKDAEKNYDVHVLQVIDNTVPEPPPGVHAAVVGGLVQHTLDDSFLVGLGVSAQGGVDCAALSLSLAAGRFTHAGEKLETRTEYRDAAGKACDPDAGAPDGGTSTCMAKEVSGYTHPKGAAVDGIKDGKVSVTWVAACAFGPALVGARLTVETGFTGTRTGELMAPKYDPVDPAPVDGGPEPAVDLAGASDGGMVD